MKCSKLQHMRHMRRRLWAATNRLFPQNSRGNSKGGEAHGLGPPLSCPAAEPPWRYIPFTFNLHGTDQSLFMLLGHSGGGVVPSTLVLISLSFAYVLRG